MKTPFTTEQFFGVFERYNTSVFPAQLVIFLLGILALSLAHSKSSIKDTLIGSFLGLLWIWSGLAYHFAFFTEINTAAYAFGSIFILQGLLLLINTFTHKLTFSFAAQGKNYIGYFFIIFGLIIYPAISFAMEGSLDKTITLGLPCPSTILTFGFLLLTTNDKFPRHILIIPSIWAIIGFSAAINFGVYQDFMLLIAALFANTLLIKQKD